MRTGKTIVFLPLAAGLLAGCPEQVGLQCPSGTVTVGQFSLTLTGDPTNTAECWASQPDGGDAGPLVQASGGAQTGTFCYGSTGGSDGGPQLRFVAPGKGTRASDFIADGGFHFFTHTDPIPGTLCGCPVAIDESFDGFLIVSPAGTPFAPLPDGGLPEVGSISGTLVDTLSTDAGSGCLCSLPCPVTYDVSGSRF